jgi:preprotein translocase subunit SecG
MLIFITIVHVLVCIFMMFVILLQPGKDAGMGSALGGGAATSAFGGRGAVTFLSKLTAVCAGIFFLTSLGLSFVGIKGSVAVGEDMNPPPASAPAPAPGEPAAPQGQTPSEQSTSPAPAAAPPAPAGTPASGATGGQEGSAVPADGAKKGEHAAPAGNSQKKPRSSERR